MKTVTPDAQLLPEIAPLMEELSARHCRSECAAYHSAWGYLRLLRALPAVGRDHDVLLGSLRAQIELGRRRILISGCADAGILAYVLAAFQSAGVRGEVTVVDLCETPLSLNVWYAERNGWAIDTWCGPIQEFEGAGYNLVVSHNFLNSIAEKERLAVAQTWANALEPSGAALLIGQIKPGQDKYGRRFDQEQIDVLVRDYTTALRKSDHRDLITTDRLEAIVRQYAKERYSHRLRSEEEFTAPLFAAGFRDIEIADIVTSLKASTAARGGRRIKLVAEKS